MPAFFEIYLAIIGAMMSGASVLAQDTANNQNIALTKETLNQQQKFSEEAAETAQQRQIDMYKQFFSPQAMTQQYREAGLNPSLIYAKGGVGGSSTAGAQAATPAAAVPYINPLIRQGQMAEMMNVVKTLTEAQKTKSETNLNEVKIEEIIATISEKQANVKLIEEKANTEVLTQLNMKLDADLKEIEKKYQGDTLENRIKIVTESYNVMTAQEENLWADLAGKEIDNKWKPELYQAEKDLKDAQKELFIAQKVIPAAQAALMQADAELKKAQKETEGKRKEELELETRKLRKIVEEYERDGYKATEANNWATEIMVVLRDIAAMLTGEKTGNARPSNAHNDEIIYNGKRWKLVNEN